MEFSKTDYESDHDRYDSSVYSDNEEEEDRFLENENEDSEYQPEDEEYDPYYYETVGKQTTKTPEQNVAIPAFPKINVSIPDKNPWDKNSHLQPTTESLSFAEIMKRQVEEEKLEKQLSKKKESQRKLEEVQSKFMLLNHKNYTTKSSNTKIKGVFKRRTFNYNKEKKKEEMK